MIERVNLPPEFPDPVLPEQVRAAVAASGRKVVALDDDPTGVQTVHDTAVLARWTVGDLAAELRRPAPLFFVLTNSRSLPEDESSRMTTAIVGNLVAAAREMGVDIAIASRSDSTLRGHFPAETDAIAAALGGVDGVLLVPAFFEGGRVTAGDVHWVASGGHLVPAAETEFARDATFGYRHSDLKAWVEEKTAGRIPAAAVASIGIEEIRRGGPARVAALLGAVAGGTPVVVNAASYRDLEVVALGVLRAEAAGKRFVYRTAASFVRARAGLGERPLLTRTELLGPGAPAGLPGLVVVGSHVKRTGEQLARLLVLPDTVGIELSVPAILEDGQPRGRAIADAVRATTAALLAGQTPVVFTSREVVAANDARGQLGVGRAVSAALVAVVRGIGATPGYVVAKGGITASDVGTAALGVRRAVVLGQISAGVPVWRLGPETSFPGLPYVVFPGNVGAAETLAEAVAMLRG